jgi:hypothetical protein
MPPYPRFDKNEKSEARELRGKVEAPAQNGKPNMHYVERTLLSAAFDFRPTALRMGRARLSVVPSDSLKAPASAAEVFVEERRFSAA